MRPTTLYISGPMQNKPGFNYAQFCEVENWLLSVEGHLHLGSFGGLRVINPARNFEGDTTLGREVYLELALRQVDESDAIVMLPDWEQSAGARLELARALHNAADVYEWHPRPGIGPVFFSVSPGAARERLEETAVQMAAPQMTDEEYRDAQALAGLEAIMAASDAGIRAVVGDPYKAPENIEQKASRLVRNGERQKDYGHPRGDFDQIGKRWTLDLDGKLKEGVSVTAEDVALMMVSLKLARLHSNPKHHDSKVDVIGYTICLDRLDEPVS